MVKETTQLGKLPPKQATVDSTGIKMILILYQNSTLKAKTMKFGSNKSTNLGYNIQVAVDAKNKLISTYDVIKNSAVQGQLYNMSKKVKDIFNVDSMEVLYLYRLRKNKKITMAA